MRLDSLVLIGQFAPLHNGHIALLHRALERADRVIVLIGSAGRARNSRHPWTAAEREQMILRMRFFEGRTQMEVAGEIGISQAQVSRLEKNALQHMRKYVSES